MDADGFTLTWQPAGTSSIRVAYLAIKGPKVYVGNDSQPTTNSSHAKTGIGFTPAALHLVGASAQAATVGTSITRGTATSSSSRSSGTMVAKSVNPLRGVTDVETNKMMRMLSDSAGTVTNAGDADLASMDADGYTLSWTGVDGTSRPFGVVALAAQPVSAWVPKIVAFG